MARYRKIDPRIWNDQKFHALSDDGKLSFLLLLTHPSMTCLGAMRATPAGLGAELGWPLPRFEEAIGESVAAGTVEINRGACFIGLPNFLKYNEPEGPNSVTNAWVKALDLIPECAEKGALIGKCRAYLETRSNAFRHAIGDAIREAFVMACPIQEPEQEQEQNNDGVSSVPTGTNPAVSDASPKDSDNEPVTAMELAEAWNEHCAQKYGLAKVGVPLTAKRLDKAKQRCREHPDDSWWGTVFVMIGQSNFLRGVNGSAAHSGWKVTFDFLISNDTNAVKIYEGQYVR